MQKGPKYKKGQALELFSTTQCDIMFKEIRVSKGKYVDGDMPTTSLWTGLAASFKWGNYIWRMDFRLTGPGDTNLKDSVELHRDFQGSVTFNDGSTIFYLSEPGTYTIHADFYVVSYGLAEMNEPMLASGSMTFEVPSTWAQYIRRKEHDTLD